MSNGQRGVDICFRYTSKIRSLSFYTFHLEHDPLKELYNPASLCLKWAKSKQFMTVPLHPIEVTHQCSCPSKQDGSQVCKCPPCAERTGQRPILWPTANCHVGGFLECSSPFAGREDKSILICLSRICIYMTKYMFCW